MSDKDNDKAAPDSPPEVPETAAPAAMTASSDQFEQDIQPSTSRGFPVLATFVLLLVLALAGACAWVVMEAQRREAALIDRLALVESVTEREVMDASEQQARIKQFNDNLKGQLQGELRGQLATLEPQLAAQAEKLRELSQQLAAVNAQVETHGQELARFDAADRQGWMLSEAEYLLRLANQRLIMTGDTESARALLRSADSILRQLDDSRLHATRAAIASELAALRAVPVLDVEGLYLRLSAVTEQAASLAIFELPEAEQRLQEAPADNWKERLRQGYQAALQKLSDYIIIRRREVPMQALMDPQWEGLVRQNLRMLIEQAQVALLSGNARLYRESLLRASSWVEQFAESDAEAARALDAELQQLANETVTVDLPEIGASLRALDRAVEQRKADAEDASAAEQ